MDKFVEYDKKFTDKNNWQIYFGFVKKYTLIYTKLQWEEYCTINKLPEVYKKLTLFTLTPEIFIIISDNKKKSNQYE